MKKKHFFEIILVLGIVLVAYGYFSQNLEWNTNSRLGLVKSIVEENRFEIDSTWKSILPTKDIAKFQNHYYSDKAIGSSLIGAAFYFPIYIISNMLKIKIRTMVFTEMLTFLAIGVVCALIAPFFYSFLKKITNSPRYAFILTIAMCLGTALYKYSTTYYGHVLAGLFLFVAFFIWFNIKNEEQITPLKVLISGYLLGYAIITEYPTLIIAFGIGLYILYILWKKKRLFDLKTYIYLLIGVLPLASIVMAYNFAVFHHPFKTGYSYELIPQFLNGQHGGIMGIGLPNLSVLFYMTLHPSMGIFWQSPFLLLSFIGWFRMWKEGQYRAEAILSFGVILVYFLMMSGYYIWWGGVAFTPRNLIPVFPFFCVPLAFIRKKWEVITLVILVLVALGQIFIVTAANSKGIETVLYLMPKLSISTTFQQPTMIYNVYLPNFLKQNMTINRGQEFFHLSGFLSLLPLVIVETGLVTIFLKLTQQKNSRSILPNAAQEYIYEK